MLFEGSLFILVLGRHYRVSCAFDWFDVDAAWRFLDTAVSICLFARDRRSYFFFLPLHGDEVLCAFSIVRPPFFVGVARRYSFTFPSFFFFFRQGFSLAFYEVAVA